MNPTDEKDPEALVAELIELLKLERLEENLFRGPSRDIGTHRVFGGQVLGQAIKAAQYTVEERQVHSLHAYFLREGDHQAPIVYDVDRSRDGGSFSARRVVAIQHGRPILTMAASFQIEEEGFDHQSPMPDIPGPEECTDISSFESESLGRIPEKLLRMLNLITSPFEVRPVEPLSALAKAGDAKPAKHLWIKAKASVPDDHLLKQAMLTYVSDYGLVSTALAPHAVNLLSTKLQMASIDHAMWFHRDFQIDQWLLYCCDSPNAVGARGLARGAFYTQDGALVATTTQEGLIRQR